MKRNPESEMEEMMEDLADELSEEKSEDLSEGLTQELELSLNKDEYKQGQKTFSDFNFQERTLLWVGICVALLVGLFSLFFGAENDSIAKDVNVVYSKLEKIEIKISQLEMNLQKTTAYEKQIKELQQSQLDLEKTRKSLKDQLAKLGKKMVQLEKGIKVKSVLQPSTNIKSPSKTQSRFYTVRPGDTLFKISQKYSVTIDALRNKNNLSKNQSIFPGLKLVIP